jgi:cell division septum initiation protein DivIVA
MDTTKNGLDLWSDSLGTASSAVFETVRPEFKTTRHGYDQAQVIDYVGRVNGRLQEVEAEVRRLRSVADQSSRELEVVLQERDAALQERDAALQERPAASEDTYEQVSSRVMELMVALNRDVEKLRGEAHGEAEHILARARSKASRIRSEAKEIRSAADLAAAQAREEADRAVADLTAQRESMVDGLRLSFARSLETIGSLASSIGDEDWAKRSDNAETSFTHDDQAAPIVELSFDQSIETITDLVSSIEDETEGGGGDSSETEAESSTSSQDDQAATFVVLPEIVPDRSA